MTRDMVTWEQARGVVAQRAKQFEAALSPDPASGRIRPVGYDAWMAAVAADFQAQPKLCEAALQAPESVWAALSVAANSGLVPGGAHKQFYLIPRWNARNQRTECTFIIGYHGLIDMAMRHPRVHKWEGFLVYEGEPFEFRPGEGKLIHVQRFDVDRSPEKIVAAYSRVALTTANGTTIDPEPMVWVMSRNELLEARDRSDGWKAFKSGKIKSTPWSTDPGPMMRKTVMRRHAGGGSVPRCADMILAMHSEDREELRLSEADAPEQAAQVATGGLRQALGMSADTPAVSPGRPVTEAAESDDVDREFNEHVRRMGGDEP